MIKKFSHIGIAVKNLNDALKFYLETLELEIPTDWVTEIPELGFRVILLQLGDNFIELVEPTDPDNDVGTFLKKRGEGIFNVCLEVEDVDAEIRALREKGLDILEVEPSNTIPYKRGFVRRRDAQGVLIEIVSSDWHSQLMSHKQITGNI